MSGAAAAPRIPYPAPGSLPTPRGPRALHCSAAWLVDGAEMTAAQNRQRDAFECETAYALTL